MRPYFRSLLLVLVLFACLVAIGSPRHSLAGDRVTGGLIASRSEVIAVHGMVATSQPLATGVALDILKAGGNAIDAAIAANAMLGLVEPTGNGIGGDLFAIVWDAKSQELYGLNASGRSPKSLTREYFVEQGMESIPAHGPLPVSVQAPSTAGSSCTNDSAACPCPRSWPRPWVMLARDSR